MAEQATGEAKGRKVVVGVDNSVLSEKAFDFLVSDVLREGDVVLIISVSEGHQEPCILPLKEAKDLTKEDLDKIGEYISKKERELKEKYEAKISQYNLHNSASIEFKSGKVGETICQEAFNCGADMIVLGSRGMGTVRRTFLGSVSDYVLHHAHIPVMIVPKNH